MPRQLGALLVLLVAAPAGGLNMLDGVKKLLLKRDSAFLYQEKALFMPGANAVSYTHLTLPTILLV